MKQIDGEVKQNVLGRCPEGKMQYTPYDVASTYDVARGLFHFTFGAFPQHILLHFPIHLLHFPNKFASFPQQIALFPQQNASFPQQNAAFPQPVSRFPNAMLCHFAKK